MPSFSPRHQYRPPSMAAACRASSFRRRLIAQGVSVSCRNRPPSCWRYGTPDPHRPMDQRAGQRNSASSGWAIKARAIFRSEVRLIGVNSRQGQWGENLMFVLPKTNCRSSPYYAHPALPLASTGLVNRDLLIVAFLHVQPVVSRIICIGGTRLQSTLSVRWDSTTHRLPIVTYA